MFIIKRIALHRKQAPKKKYNLCNRRTENINLPKLTNTSQLNIEQNSVPVIKIDPKKFVYTFLLDG